MSSLLPKKCWCGQHRCNIDLAASFCGGSTATLNTKTIGVAALRFKQLQQSFNSSVQQTKHEMAVPVTAQIDAWMLVLISRRLVSAAKVVPAIKSGQLTAKAVALLISKFIPTTLVFGILPACLTVVKSAVAETLDAGLTLMLLLAIIESEKIALQERNVNG